MSTFQEIWRFKRCETSNKCSLKNKKMNIRFPKKKCPAASYHNVRERERECDPEKETPCRIIQTVIEFFDRYWSRNFSSLKNSKLLQILKTCKKVISISINWKSIIVKKWGEWYKLFVLSTKIIQWRYTKKFERVEKGTTSSKKYYDLFL